MAHTKGRSSSPSEVEEQSYGKLRTYLQESKFQEELTLQTKEHSKHGGTQNLPSVDCR